MLPQIAAIQLALGTVAIAPAVVAPDADEVTAVQTVTDDDLLLLAVDLDQLTLTETLGAHGAPDDPLLPVGELSRLLDLDVDVYPSEQRIVGRIGDERRSIFVDLRRGLARMAGADFKVSPSDAAIGNGEIFLRASFLERILPLKIKVDSENLSAKLTALEKLPIQLRWERFGRSGGSNAGFHAADDPVIALKAPYAVVSPPTFDVALESGRDTRTARSFSNRFDIRVANDLLYSNFQGYVGSDDVGRPSSARLLLERRSVSGQLPLGARRISAGDVFTPALALGPRSSAGRGISMSTAALQEASVFNTIDLRGELPIGYDVELYVNDVLRSGQRTPVEGRYEFLAVPLVRGINILRIVTYGPRGDRSEVTRVINVGGGQLKRGESQFEFGAVDQDRALIQLSPGTDKKNSPYSQGLRVVAGGSYGLSDEVTIVGGAAFLPRQENGKRLLGTAGVRTALYGLAVQLDGAVDNSGAIALATGFAGQPLGASMLLQHVEYRKGFVDEAVLGTNLVSGAVRHTALTLDFSSPPVGGKRIPLSFRGLRDEFSDGATSYLASARTSATLLNTLVSTGLDYERTRRDGQKSDRLTGATSASRFLKLRWQLRATADYDLLPSSALRALSLTADRNLSETTALRFGIGKSFGEVRETFAQAGGVLRLPIGELALSADYSIDSRLANQCPLRLWLIVRPDPWQVHYDTARPCFRQ